METHILHFRRPHRTVEEEGNAIAAEAARILANPPLGANAPGDLDDLLCELVIHLNEAHTMLVKIPVVKHRDVMEDDVIHSTLLTEVIFWGAREGLFRFPRKRVWCCGETWRVV